MAHEVAVHRCHGTWGPRWEPPFARKLVRRLWGEEIQHALSIASGVLGCGAPSDFDWTKQLDTLFGRTFEYVPAAADGLYVAIDELWG